MELALDWKPSLALASMEKGVLMLQNPHLSRHLPACSAPQFPPISPTILLDHCSLTNHFTFPSVLVNKSFELCSFVHHSAFMYA